MLVLFLLKPLFKFYSFSIFSFNISVFISTRKQVNYCKFPKTLEYKVKQKFVIFIQIAKR
eukprot:snap_masked-scaffold_15-processed-gene-4.29-mRNA-1 protein AED:1.00 eAED:1.00 QI:0/0/0/0/1/1/3/0/59